MGDVWLGIQCMPLLPANILRTAGHTVALGQGFPEVLTEFCDTMLPVNLHVLHSRAYRNASAH